jgi:hypothetical protein
MTSTSCLREAKTLLSANKVAEAHTLIETVVYSLLNTENLRHAAKINLIFLGRLARQAENTELSGRCSRR